MLELLGGMAELSLAFLNEATQAWVEIEYNRRPHREIAYSPVDRFARASDVLRASPSSDALRDAFRMEGSRKERQSDGTISVEGVRFEVPGRYRHFRKDRQVGDAADCRRTPTSAPSSGNWTSR